MATTSSPVAEAVRPTWIWYPGDFEVWLGNEFNNRRTERGAMFPPFWKQDSHWPTVVFRKTVCIDEDEFIDVIKLPFSEAVQMVYEGKFPDAKTQLAILKAAKLMED